MPELTVQEVDEDGLNASYVAANAGGDYFANPVGDRFIHVKNAGGGSINVTVTAQDTDADISGFGTLTKASQVIAVPAGEDRFVGPFPLRAFNDANGDVQLTYSGVTSVTIAALRLPTAR